MDKIKFYSNCLFFALKRLFKSGGYIAFRKSRMGSWFPHILWIKDLKDAEIEHFVPTDTSDMRIPPPLFEGYIKRDDKR